MPLHGGLSSLQSLSLNIQTKLMTKLAKYAASGSLTHHEIFDTASTRNLNEIHDFIKLMDSEETAKRIVDDIVAVSCKLAVVYYNGLFSYPEEDLLLEYAGAEQKFARSFLKEAEAKTGDYGEILKHLGVMADKTDQLLKLRFSPKTQHRARKVFGYFLRSEPYQFLLTGDSAAHLRLVASTLMCTMLENSVGIVNTITERRNTNRRMLQLKKLSKKIQKEQYAKLEAAQEVKLKEPSQEMIGEKALASIGTIQKFIERESKDEKKAEDLTGNIIAIVAVLEAGFSAEIYTEEDQLKLMDLVGTVRNLIGTFLHVFNTSNTNQETFDDLLKLYEAVEVKLCELLRHHFDGESLDKAKSLFYYFKKEEVNMFYFKEMRGTALRAEIEGVLREGLECIPSSVLCEPQ